MSSNVARFEENLLAAGSWITDQFLQDMLQLNETESKIQVVGKTVAAAVALGNNYLSNLYRVTVKYTKDGHEAEDKHIIIKAYPSIKILQTMVEEMGVFDKEILMYKKVLPEMKRLTRDFFSEEFFAPETYECLEKNTIIMEDLKKFGYKMANRQDQLNFKQCSRILQTLARFHALSMLIKRERPELAEVLFKEVCDKDAEKHMGAFIKMQVPFIIKMCSQTGSLLKYTEVMTEFNEKGFDAVTKCLSPEERGPFTVLNHGDMWLTNFMFKQDQNGDVIQAKLLDFQLSRYSSPGLDVLQLLCTSPQAEVLTLHKLDLIKIYHEALRSDLKSLGLENESFSLEDLHKSIRERAAYGFFLLCCMLPGVLTSADDIPDLEKFEDLTTYEIKDEENPLRKIFENERTRSKYEKFFDFFEEMGYFEEIKKQLGMRS